MLLNVYVRMHVHAPMPVDTHAEGAWEEAPGMMIRDRETHLKREKESERERERERERVSE